MKGSWRLLGGCKTLALAESTRNSMISFLLVHSMLLPKTEQIHSKTDEVVLMVRCSAVTACISCKSSIQEIERLVREELEPQAEKVYKGS